MSLKTYWHNQPRSASEITHWHIGPLRLRVCMLYDYQWSMQLKTAKINTVNLTATCPECRKRYDSL